MEQLEGEFMERINAKEVGAYRDLFRMYYRYLVLYAQRFVQQLEPAEDIVQEVFAALWKSERKYNSFHGFRAFLYESVKNGCLNYLNRKKQEQRYIDYSLRTEQEEQEDAEGYELMREEILRKIYRMVEELPEGCRRVFEHHLKGKKNEEIAAALQISIETVKSQKKKALRFLRERLGNVYALAVSMGFLGNL